ncbi:MAG: patatin-like phospholipase family protein [Saprospiraceae bacterium]
MRKTLQHIYHSFPVQLLLLHLRSNLLLLSPWVVLLLMMSGRLGRKLGLQYLFLDPEYMGEVGFASFFLNGMALGGFFMSWNLTTYLLTAHHFPFLASLSRPFSKFSLNNLLLPLVFGGFYLFLIGYFQQAYQVLPLSAILIHLLSLVLGALTLIAGYSLYFNFTNRDISYYGKRYAPPPNLVDLHFLPGRRGMEVDYIKLDQSRLKVWTYLNERLRPRLVRSVAHYESRMLLDIFRQNHLNALALQLISMMMLLLLGYLVDWELFRIPAAASIIILFSLLVAVMGALTYWFAEWRAIVIILLLVGINFITTFPAFHHVNLAYGLRYDTIQAPYNYSALQDLCREERITQDKIATQAILDNRLKFAPYSLRRKPKVVILCASGGGLKAATWSMKVLQTADSLSQGKLLDRTILMTGASGGMLGMAYLRELYWLQQQDIIPSSNNPAYIEDISSDILNALAFTYVSNDLFLPWRRFEYADQYWFLDRGYVFEEQFNNNTHGILNKPVVAYRQAEETGQIPMLYLTPAIVNDGRQMVISPHPVAFMMQPPTGVGKNGRYEIDAVDFRALLAAQQVDSLRFLTALRMNATFPYVLPTVHLPTTPGVSLVDAGFRDNYGIQAATRFIHVYRDWILSQTSGVILVQISSSEKIEQIPANTSRGIIESIFNPLGIAGKVLAVQELTHDNNLGLINDLLGEKHFHLIRFIYHPVNDNKLEASVSFHLTAQEKQDVLRALQLENNRKVCST